MSGALKLVILDVDGTLVDSQAHILASMARAFEAAGRPAPTREATLSIVGLSLPQAMARLVPDAGVGEIERLVDGYKAGFAGLRQAGDGAADSPLYPGAKDALNTLSSIDEVFLGVATGKSRRGLDHLIDLHGFHDLFHTIQVADDHPSKPHPSMIHQCLADTGVDAAHAVIVGDTTYDIEMGRAAGIHALGVSWGYHRAEALTQAGASRVLSAFAELPGALEEIWAA